MATLVTEPTCYDCKHSYAFGKVTQEKLQCRWGPPTVIESFEAWFPLVHSYWSCGKHEPEPKHPLDTDEWEVIDDSANEECEHPAWAHEAAFPGLGVDRKTCYVCGLVMAKRD